MTRRKIVLLSTSPFPYGNNITDGPGYRAWHLFQDLAQRHEIVILSLYESFHLKISKEHEVFEDNIRIKCVDYKPRSVANRIKQEKPDVLYLPWSSVPFLSSLNKKIPTIIDYVGAGLLEEYATRGYIPITFLQMKLKSFWLGDFLMTAGHRERYYLLGLLAASKKLSYTTRNRNDPLIHVIPMTSPRAPPRLREKVIERKPDELILLVAGAFLPWYDYTTFFEALKSLCKKGRTNFKVIFMGGNPRDLGFEKTIRKMTETPELQNRIIYAGLVPFKQRADYYLSSDVAINIPSTTIEDELSVRTRIVDYVWGQLPIVTPAKDEYSQAVVMEGGGFVYEAGNSSSLAKTIEAIMDDRGKLDAARKKTKNLLDTTFNLKNYLPIVESFIENPYVDAARSSPRRMVPEFVFVVRDILQLLR